MKAMRDAWAEALIDVAGDDPRLLVVDPDVANSTKADRFAAAFPERFLQVGIAEQNLVGVAVGLTSFGYVPWISTFTPFLSHRAIDQIRMLVAQNNANVKIAGAYSGLLTGLTGRTHQDVEDIAIIRAMPGMTLLSPADPSECAAMVRWASAHAGPVYMRIARDPEDDVFDVGYDYVPNTTSTLREGHDVTLVSTGVQTARVLAAATLLANSGIEARVVHVPTIRPLGASVLASALAGSRHVVTVEEHSIVGGLGGLVTEVLGELSPAPVHRIGLRDVWTESAPNAFLLDKYGLSAGRVAEQVVARLESFATA